MEDLRRDTGILDVAIIGGGPAGTAAAVEARRLGLRAGIWDRNRFPRDKVCGEFISPAALPLLQTEIPQAAAKGEPIFRAGFVSAGGLSRTFHLPRPALGLSRRLLDDALWKAAQAAGVEAHAGESILKAGKGVSGWEIECESGSVRRTRSLIIACGRWWRIGGLSSPARHERAERAAGWVGAKAHFAGIASCGKVEMYFFRGGYCGLAPVEDGGCNVCCLVRRELMREHSARGIRDFSAWLVKLACHPALEARLRGAEQISPIVTTAPVYLARGKAAEGGALLAGDASGFLDPFTGEGISMAMHSGRLAAQAIARSLSAGTGGEQAAELYARALDQSVRRTYRIAATARGLMQGPVWLQGLATAPLPWIGKSLVRETRWRGGLGWSP